jgi:DNA-binding XRE family transcriptional regulator
MDRNQSDKHLGARSLSEKRKMLFRRQPCEAVFDALNRALAHESSSTTPAKPDISCQEFSNQEKCPSICRFQKSLGWTGNMDASIPSEILDKLTTFGELLRYLRRRAGLTQTQLSIAVGCSDAQISRLEQNLRLPNLATVQARFLPVPAAQERAGRP